MPNEFIIKNGFRSQGNSEITGSLSVSGSISTISPINLSGFATGSVLFTSGSAGAITGSANLTWNNTDSILNLGTNTTNNARIVFNYSLLSSLNGILWADNLANPYGYISLDRSSGEFRSFTGTSYFPTFYSSNAEAMRIATTRNVLIGTTTDSGYKLDVNGTARIKGLGSGSSTTSFTVQNSADRIIFSVQDENGITVNSQNDTANINIQNAGETRFRIRQNNATLSFIGAATSTGGYNFSNSVLNTDGRNSASLIAVDAPQILFSSGTNNYRSLTLNYTINTSGGANIVTGLRINPTLTSLTGTTHRAIETVTGDVLFGTTSGNVGIGTTTPTSRLTVSGSAGTGSAIYAYKSGSTVLDIQGSQGQLFSVIDALSGSLMSVNDVSGLPILEVFSDDRVVMGTYGAPALIVTGSNTIISGSLRGRVVTLSTASATASMDCSLSNFFDLTLSGSMYLGVSNIQPGETINLRITQPATSGSLNYTSSIKFPNGLPYSASATSSVVDLISFISFDSSTLYATSLKNLI